MADNDRRSICEDAEGNDVSGASIEEKEKGGKSSPFNVKSYVAIISLLGVFLTTEQMLRFSVLTTLERRFKFTTSHNGIIVSAYDIGHVVLLVVLSVVGAKVHRPRMCALGGFLSGIACIVWAVPHFIFGSGALESIAVSQTNISAADSLGVDFCSYGHNISSGMLAPTGCSDVILNNATVTDGSSTETIVSFSLFFLSQCLLGAGLAPFLTVAITYLDDNTDPASSALGVSIFLSVASTGLVLGFLFGAGMTGIHVDLQASEMTSADPGWIGAWWFGSVILSAIIFLLSTPLLFFPRVLQKPEVTTRQRTESTASRDTTAEKMRPMLQRRVSVIKDIGELKNVPGRTKSLGTNIVYICATLAMCSVTYLSAALFPFLPKYLETQFNVEPMMANIITSMVTALAVASGTFTGGYIASAKELDPLGSAKLVLVGLSIGLTTFSIALFMGCPSQDIIGLRQTSGLAESALSCEGSCFCDHARFAPVCGDNELTYFSACHAGCTHISSQQPVSTFNCSCKGSLPEIGEATLGKCDTGCVTLVPYSILIFITTFSICMGTSPIVAILIRSVSPEQKSIALGINNVLTSILAAIPGPMLYGVMIDSTCELTDKSCDGKVTCVLYNNDRFRFLLHGVTEVFVFLTAVCILIVFFKLRRKNSSEKEEVGAKGVGENDNQEEEAQPMVDHNQRV